MFFAFEKISRYIIFTVHRLNRGNSWMRYLQEYFDFKD